MAHIFEFNFVDKVDNEDSEILQMMEITLPNLKFEDIILEKTFLTRKYGIIGQASSKDFLTLEDSDIFRDNKVQA
jgi:hypothetical protein